MASRMLAAFAILAAAGTAFAQSPGGNASNPTRVEADSTGPQDSIGTAGESPTKRMIEKSGKKDAKTDAKADAKARNGGTGTDKPASAIGGKPGASGHTGHGSEK